MAALQTSMACRPPCGVTASTSWSHVAPRWPRSAHAAACRAPGVPLGAAAPSDCARVRAGALPYVAELREPEATEVAAGQEAARPVRLRQGDRAARRTFCH